MKSAQASSARESFPPKTPQSPQFLAMQPCIGPLKSPEEDDMDFSKLKSAAMDAAKTPILDRFNDSDRAKSFSVLAGDLLFDYSKTSMDAAGRQALIDLFEGADVPKRRDAMFTGEAINETEGRAVLHTALRNLDGGPVVVDGVDVMPGVLATLERM